MAKFYSGINTSVGIGSETLDSMLANGSTYGISPSKDIDCQDYICRKCKYHRGYNCYILIICKWQII